MKETVLDFSRTKEKARELFSHKKRTKIFNLDRTNALLEFLLEGAPELREMTLNSKKDVDLVLKTSCEELILHLTSMLTHPLSVRGLQVLGNSRSCVEFGTESLNNQVLIL